MIGMCEYKKCGSDDAEHTLGVNDRSVLVSAGPGTGKTRYLAKKAIRLLNNGGCNAPQKILAISYTRDAEKSLADRVKELGRNSDIRRFQSMTFDSFSKGIVDRFRKIIDPEWQPNENYIIRTIGDKEMKSMYTRYAGAKNKWSAFENTLAIADVCKLHNEENLNNNVLKYWQECYRCPEETILSFTMINRLAKNIFKNNAIVLRALRKTFPIVFVDELQDTTEAQYDLLKMAFLHNDVCITAVGDRNQRIMTWAGAKIDSFSAFVKDFDPIEVGLSENKRTHSGMINIQHRIIETIDDNASKPLAERVTDIEEPYSAILEFPNREEESKAIAEWICQGRMSSGLHVGSVAILARMQTQKIEKALSPHFLERNMQVRDIGRDLGRITVREVLSEHITNMIVSTLKVGANKTCPRSWNMAFDYLVHLRRAGLEDEKERNFVQTQLQECIRNIRTMMYVGFNMQQLGVILNYVLEFWKSHNVSQAFPAYRRSQDLDRVLRGVRKLLTDGIPHTSSWAELLDWFEGGDQVPLMTIHKSKGMEFERVIVLGIDKMRWWEFDDEVFEEKVRLIFVSLTRAREKTYFTCCKNYGGTLTWLGELLDSCGVRRIPGRQLLTVPW